MLFNTIFKKLFITFVSIIIISVIFLGVVVSRVLTDYFVSEKEKMLRERAYAVSEIYRELYISNNSIKAFNKLVTEIRTIYQYLDASFIFVDNNFVVTLSAGKNLENIIGMEISEKRLLPVMEGKVISINGNLSGIFAEDAIILAYPLYVYNKVVGAMLISPNMAELQNSISYVFRIIIICLLISVTIAFILMYILSSALSTKLQEMSNVAKVIESGNFERRIKINSKDEIGQLAVSLNNMAESLSQQDNFKREFIANISHDIRTPLTTIEGFIKAILDETIQSESQDKYLLIVLDETNRLKKLANDVLELNYFKSGGTEVTKTDFDISQLIREVCTKFERVLYEKNITLNITLANEKTIVSADQDKVERIIYNLLDNAVKFVNINGNINIETTMLENKLSISVLDDGIGISEENQKRVFDRFYKADSSRGIDKKGNGLGLAIVREFIKAHGEIIQVKSEEGKGTEFIFKLDLK